eukprot:CAMPEP_0202801370 /NCGR_PEP_ID=MMETSP1388-20130828/102106_1 /ASSEMBLY_ACC=CAM_ASM_000864 /TAXON_ID=37098 /ORGANISM="Isochrysis sp, Strain CCMP1244" /LENGTH=195 /DNA_ID=CAMNT_0049471363 /DNA_START=573 /DNA_END=1157 /DNA_ORIENTATION=-
MSSCGQKHERHLVVAPREAQVCQVLVESAGDELLWRDLKKSIELDAAEVRVVLVRHDDLQPTLARLLDLIGQPLVANEAVLVKVEQHVRGLPRLVGGGDGEAAAKRGGDLVSQVQCARVGRRGPDRGWFGEGERLALGLARDAEREGGLVQKGGRAEKQRLGDDLEGDELKLIDAIPDRERPVLVKDVGLQVLGA